MLIIFTGLYLTSFVVRLTAYVKSGFEQLSRNRFYSQVHCRWRRHILVLSGPYLNMRRIHVKKIFFHILVWSPISNTRSLWMTLQYPCSFRTVHHQKQASGAKTFFKVFYWNQISSKPILLRFFAQVHRWWQCLFKYFQVLTWSGEGPRGKIIFLHFDWNHISIELILFKYFMKVHWSWQWFI